MCACAEIECQQQQSCRRVPKRRFVANCRQEPFSQQHFCKWKQTVDVLDLSMYQQDCFCMVNQFLYFQGGSVMIPSLHAADFLYFLFSFCLGPLLIKCKKIVDELSIRLLSRGVGYQEAFNTRIQGHRQPLWFGRSSSQCSLSLYSFDLWRNASLTTVSVSMLATLRRNSQSTQRLSISGTINNAKRITYRTHDLQLLLYGAVPALSGLFLPFFGSASSGVLLLQIRESYLHRYFFFGSASSGVLTLNSTKLSSQRYFSLGLPARRPSS